jgi:hypothetical protein
MERKFSISLLALLLCTFIANAQSKFGNVTMEELQMTSYPQDTSAVALILLKDGDTRFIYSEHKGFSFEYTQKIKIKILKDEGLEWCNQQIDYYEANRDSKEEINGLSGTTYNLENGKIVKTKLSKEFIFDGDTNENWKVKKFTMPAAKVGSVIEFKYSIESNFFWELRDFKFQSSIPILYTRYEVTIPEYYNYNVNMSGYIRVGSKEEPGNDGFTYTYKDYDGKLRSDRFSFSTLKRVFTAEDVPALKNTKFIWCKDDYISKVTFELRSTKFPNQMVKTYTSSWDRIDEQLLKSSFGSNLKKTGLFKNDIKETEITLANATDILSMIKSRVKWNEKNSFYPSNLNDALKNGLGSSADMNFLLINALKAAGFEAYPIVLSTRGNGMLPIGHPSISALNYVIAGVTIDAKEYYADASGKYGSWNLLPEKCMVTRARFLKENHKDWVDLSTVSSGSTLVTTKSQFEDNQYKTNIMWVRKGNEASRFRSHYFEGHKDKDDYISKLATSMEGEISDFEIENETDPNKEVKVNFTLSQDITTGDDHIYINPLSLQIFKENPFTEEERIFPVLFNYLNNYVQIAELTIPDGYEVEELPKSERFIFDENSPISFTYNVRHQGDKIVLQYKYQLKQLLFMQDQYPILKDFYAKIVSKNSEQIVLKRKSDTEVAAITE